MRYFIGRVLILLSSLLSQTVFSFVLRNEFYVLNASKRVYDINYIVCRFTLDNKQRNTKCDVDSFFRLAPGQSKSIAVDENDNYYYTEEKAFERGIYIYQVSSQSSEGIFLRGNEDYTNYLKDHKNDLMKGYVAYCTPSRKQSVILDDFGTDRIYCHAAS